MKIIMHIGLPKCGSTSIQNSLKQVSISINEAAIFYSPRSTIFNNHHYIAEAIRSDDSLDSIFSGLKEDLEIANSLAVKYFIISAEDLFFCASIENHFCRFLELIDFLSAYDLEILAVIRNIHDLMRSYFSQLNANGVNPFSREMLNFGVFIIKSIKQFVSLPVKTNILSMDQAVLKGGLLKVFYKQILNSEIDTPERKDNSSKQLLSFPLEALVGKICSIYALNNDTHINSPIVDELRSELRSNFMAKSQTEVLSTELVQYINALTEPLLEDFYKNCLSKIPEEDYSFFLDNSSRVITSYYREQKIF